MSDENVGAMPIYTICVYNIYAVSVYELANPGTRVTGLPEKLIDSAAHFSRNNPMWGVQ